MDADHVNLSEKPVLGSVPVFAPPVRSEQMPAGKKLTKDLVLSKSKGGSLVELKKIVIWGQKITDCSIVTEIPELEVASMTANQISSLEHFGQCPNLRELFLRSNCIQDIHQIYYLRDLPNLQVLWLAGNPCTEHPKYRSSVIRNLEQLQKLDDTEISQAERAASESEGLLFDQPPPREPVATDADFSCSSLAERMEPAKDVPVPEVAGASATEPLKPSESPAAGASAEDAAAPSQATGPPPVGGNDTAVEKQAPETIADVAVGTAVLASTPAIPPVSQPSAPPSLPATPLPGYALKEVRMAVLRLIRLLDQESLQLVLLTVRSRLEQEQQTAPADSQQPQQQQQAGGTAADISASFSLDNL